MNAAMKRALRAGYAAAVQLARGAAAVSDVIPGRAGKLRHSLAARRGIRARFRNWGQDGRDSTRPLLWMHAPSVGEGLQARPVLALARLHRPELQLAYTHFSPSAQAFAASLDADFTDYLPFDSRTDAEIALRALRPTALVFAKLDVWPTLVRTAHQRGVRLGMISATLAPGSSRLRGISSALLRDAYALLDAVGAVDVADAERLVQLGVREGVIRVTGDTRYDQVWERVQRVDRTSALLAPLAGGPPTLVAGSTWPSDERVLLEAWLRSRAAVPGARLVIAPHEPTEEHLEPLERWSRRNALRVARLGSAAARDAEVVLVDRVGVLGDLYAVGDVAFVGGAFHSAGLHSVLEPASHGVPVLFGPRFSGSRDAALLVAAGGALAVRAPQDTAERLILWLQDADARRRASGAAREVVRSGLGAAARSWQLVEELLD